MCQRGRVSLGRMTYKTNKYKQICNDCLCGTVEVKMDFKGTGLSKGVSRIRDRDRDRVT